MSRLMTRESHTHVLWWNMLARFVFTVNRVIRNFRGKRDDLHYPFRGQFHVVSTFPHSDQVESIFSLLILPGVHAPRDEHSTLPLSQRNGWLATLIMSLIGIGSTGTVYQLNTFIAVKRCRAGGYEGGDHVNEQTVFQLLNNHPPIPHIIRCFHTSPGATFLEVAANGTVCMLLQRNQRREPKTGQVLEVRKNLDKSDVQRWMRQLCIAVAGLEALDLVHGDIRPTNLLLDDRWDLKLCDFDRTVRVGQDLLALTEPFARLLDDGDLGQSGTYGTAGARSETFAIGSIYYSLLRGHDPYEMEYWGDKHFALLSEKLQRKEFPTLTSSAEDFVIRRCWDGEFLSVTELLEQFPGGSDGGEERTEEKGVCENGKENEVDSSACRDEEWVQARVRECEFFLESGAVNSLHGF